eukprot:scaffold70081_cov69-Cyclotella_meneghiniana.AAC.2
MTRANVLSWLIAIALYATTTSQCIFTRAFTASPTKSTTKRQPARDVNIQHVQHDGPAADIASNQRRLVLSTIMSAPLLTLSNTANSAERIPSITSDEFDIILKSSSKSISIVELSGPKSESCLVKLVDGTQFTISDLIESSTDPRSPLKLVSRCRLYNVPVKNVGLLSAVGKTGESGKKKKVYSNERVRAADEKNEERKLRMEEDERERLAELFKQQQLEGEL